MLQHEHLVLNIWGHSNCRDHLGKPFAGILTATDFCTLSFGAKPLPMRRDNFIARIPPKFHRFGAYLAAGGGGGGPGLKREVETSANLLTKARIFEEWGVGETGGSCYFAMGLNQAATSKTKIAAGPRMVRKGGGVMEALN